MPDPIPLATSAPPLLSSAGVLTPRLAGSSRTLPWWLQRRTREELKADLTCPLHSEQARRELVFLAHEEIYRRDFVLALNHDRLVGVLSLSRDSHRVPGAMALSFVSVCDDFRGRGIARALVKEAFSWAAQRGQDLAVTRYCPPMGPWLQKVLQHEAPNWPDVQLHEHPGSFHV